MVAGGKGWLGVWFCTVRHQDSWVLFVGKLIFLQKVWVKWVDHVLLINNIVNMNPNTQPNNMTPAGMDPRAGNLLFDNLGLIEVLRISEIGFQTPTSKLNMSSLPPVRTAVAGRQ